MSEKLKFFEVTVMARAGAPDVVPAQLVCCPACCQSAYPADGPRNPTHWIIFAIFAGEDSHMHLQCAACDTTYCEGKRQCH